MILRPLPSTKLDGFEFVCEHYEIREMSFQVSVRPVMASVKYVGVGSYATDPHVRAMVLARLA